MSTPLLPDDPLLKAIWSSGIGMSAVRAKQNERARIERSKEVAYALSASYRAFVEHAWSTVEPARPFIPTMHVDAIAEHLQAVADGQIARLVISIPPGHTKSTLASVMFHPWVWTRDPVKRFINTAYGGVPNPSTRDAIKARALIESPWYQETFRPEWKMRPDRNLIQHYENTRTGYRLSFTVGSGTGLRADVQMVDDPLSVSKQDSTAELERVLFWWDHLMSNRVFDPLRSARIIIMQRLSERDLAGEMLARGGWEHLCLPSLYEPDKKCSTSIGWTDPRTVEGELLFPSLYPHQVIEQARKDLGERGFSAQHQQRPSPATGGIFKRYWWRFWKYPGVDMPPVAFKNDKGELSESIIEDLPDEGQEYQSWDCAFKAAQDSDYVCGGVVRQLGSRYYLLHMDKRRLDFPATCAAIREMSAAYPNAVAKYIEDKANGPAVMATLAEEIEGLIPVEPMGGKVARANGVAPKVEAGNVYLPHPQIAPWVRDFIDSLAMFPNGKHDDDVDMFTQALARSTKMVFPYSNSEIVAATPADIGPLWRRCWGMYADWKAAGIVWLAENPETRVWYAYAEHHTSRKEIALHVEAIKQRGAWIPGVLDVAPHGDWLDTFAITKQYQAAGLRCGPVMDIRERGVEVMANMLGVGSLKVCAACPTLLAQYAAFSRDKSGNLPKEGSQMVFALMAAVVAGTGRSARNPGKQAVVAMPRYGGGMLGGLR